MQHFARRAEQTNREEDLLLNPIHAAAVTFFVSMVPVLELRGAIPLGVAGGLTPLSALVIAVLGNLVPVPFLIVFTRRIFQWLKHQGRIRVLVEKLEHRAAHKGEVVKKYASLGLFVLVAIPLPGTGAWTGALVAAMLDIRLKYALPAISLGVVAAGLIMTLLTFGASHLLG